MKYTKEELLSSDIDWFFIINEAYIHVASAGGMIPEQINDIRMLKKIQRKVHNLPFIFEEQEIIFNENLLYERFGNKTNSSQRTDYLRSFIEMSRKGFISMDRTNLSDSEDNTYHIVCMPKKSKLIIGLEELFRIRHSIDVYNKPIGNIDLLSFFG